MLMMENPQIKVAESRISDWRRINKKNHLLFESDFYFICIALLMKRACQVVITVTTESVSSLGREASGPKAAGRNELQVADLSLLC